MSTPEDAAGAGGRSGSAATGTVSIARALSKLGHCSRAQGERLVQAGRVRVEGRIVRDPAQRVRPERDAIEVDGVPVRREARHYVMLNKPRGLVTTRHDPRGRPTIYECFAGEPLPFLAPVGRLDKASEGLLLLTNDSRWSARLLEPSSHVEKRYHVQVRAADPHSVIDRVRAGVTEQTSGERLDVGAISLLRTGSRGGAWFEIVLEEGKNRQLRRIFSEVGVEVLRLIRVSIGALALGDLAKGSWRPLTAAEVRALAGAGR